MPGSVTPNALRFRCVPVTRTVWAHSQCVSASLLAVQALLEAVYGRDNVRRMPNDTSRAFAYLTSISNDVTLCMDQGVVEVRERDKKAFRWVNHTLVTKRREHMYRLVSALVR